MQICTLLTRIQCKVSDTKVTVKACGPLVGETQCKRITVILDLFIYNIPLDRSSLWGSALLLSKVERRTEEDPTSTLTCKYNDTQESSQLTFVVVVFWHIILFIFSYKEIKKSM